MNRVFRAHFYTFCAKFEGICLNVLMECEKPHRKPEFVDNMTDEIMSKIMSSSAFLRGVMSDKTK